MEKESQDSGGFPEKGDSTKLQGSAEGNSVSSNVHVSSRMMCYICSLLFSFTLKVQALHHLSHQNFL